jgi:RNA polymerase sigma-70 factor, ECF subfamily
MAVQAETPIGHRAEDEAEQVRRAKARDAEVWASWHDAYYPLIYRYAFARLGNREDSEDTTSQVFLEAIKSIDRFAYRGRPVIAWLYGIAHHLVSRRRRDVARGGGSLAESHLEASEAPGEEASTLDRLVVQSVLGRLKEEHREVLILRFMLDLPSKEVARILGKSELAIYSLQVRALTAARRIATGRIATQADQRRGAA